jgi:hypothetical protein
MIMGGNNLTGLGGAGGGAIVNSGMGGVGAVGESEMDIEFGYCSEEESIFQSFS